MSETAVNPEAPPTAKEQLFLLLAQALPLVMEAIDERDREEEEYINQEQLNHQRRVADNDHHPEQRLWERLFIDMVVHGMPPDEAADKADASIKAWSKRWRVTPQTVLRVATGAPLEERSTGPRPADDA